MLVDNFFYSRADRKLSVEVSPHLGLMSLASTLEAAGQEVDILDPKILFSQGNWAEPGAGFLDSWANDLLDRKADIIGFTAYGRSLPYVIRAAERIKAARPKQTILLGGPHATIVGERILKAFSCFDAVVQYEAEPVIADAVNAFTRGNDPGAIPNLLYRAGNQIAATARHTYLPELDALPEPALHLYPIDRLRLAELSIEAGRGCPFDCTFCSTSRFFQRRYRIKSSSRMIEEMETARARYGINLFNLNHDLFGLVKKSVHEFCGLARGRGFQWKCSMRPDTIDSELAAALETAGCRHIYFGVETGSERLQKAIAKNLKLERTPKVLADVISRGIHCTASFITGFPDETEEEQDQTLDLIGDLLKLDPQRLLPQLHVLSPEPGSCLAEGSLPSFYDGIGPEVGEALDDELIRSAPDVFSVFYHYDSLVPRWRTVMASAFVTHLIAELGYPLTAHLIVNYFAGSLAKLFRETVREAPAPTAHYDTAIGSLRYGLGSAIARVAGDSPYLPDLVRLSRILSTIGRVSWAGAMDGDLGFASGTWLARFDHDVLSSAQCILRNPASRVPAAGLGDRGHWFLFKRDASGQLLTGTLDEDSGRRLYSLAPERAGPPNEFFNDFRDLGVRFIRC